MVNIGDIPKELQEGLDIERYTLTIEDLQPMEPPENKDTKSESVE